MVLHSHIRLGLWNAYAFVYDALPRFFQPYKTQLDQVIGIVRSSNLSADALVLDAGCGTGHYLMRLGQLGYQVIGLDAAPQMLARAEKKLRRAKQEAQLLIADLNALLPFEAETFDCIVSINALFMVENQESALREFRRVLRPGGLLVLSNPCEIPPLSSVVAEHARRYGIASVILPMGAFAALGLFNWLIARNFASGEYRGWSADEMQIRLSKAGFDIDSMEKAYACGSNLLVCARRPVRVEDTPRVRGVVTLPHKRRVLFSCDGLPGSAETPHCGPNVSVEKQRGYVR